MTMIEEGRKALITLLWDHLEPDPDYAGRRRTGWGTKTKTGLIACIDRITSADFRPPQDQADEGSPSL